MSLIEQSLDISTIQYPEELPVSQRRVEIQSLIQTNQVLIVCGETGSGKTTQLPKMCLELGRGQGGKSIVHTQPRRLAATSTAKRIASELGSEIGQVVGYKIRFVEKAAQHTQVKLVTDGILLAESQSDPLFSAYDTIIIDEAHERSLNIDFLLGYLKQVLPKRPDLKLIVTSATIDAQRFAAHFADADGNPAPVIEVSGRLYPVEIRYKDPSEYDQRKRKKPDAKPQPATKPADDVDEDAFNEAALDAVHELNRLGQGDILMFLPGEREIREMSQFFKKQLTGVEVLPLFSRLSAADQERIFKPGGRRRIVLATNVAETSLTVPGIHYVIDSGMARVKRYSYRNKVEMLQVERVSRASANQRAGRCGRVASGVCIRLYSEDDFQARSEFTAPEILRSSLASVILRMKSLHLTEVEDFPFLQRPMGRAIADGYQLLQELNALDEQGRLTKVGRSLARLPLDPRIARMLAEAAHVGCLAELLVIASALSVQDPRERPHDAQEAADQAQKVFDDPDSDFISYLNIWKYYSDLKSENATNSQVRSALARKFLNANRMREWTEVHAQLVSMVREHHWTINTTPAKPDQIHLALLAGLLGNIGLKHETDPVYLGARSIRFAIHPSSALFKKGGKWIVAGELMETTRLYARCVAKIQSDWLERVGAHLIKRNHASPHWEKSSGQAVALETGLIYGLPVYSKRRISLARFDQAGARKLMIQEGLVQGQVQTRLGFYVHNQRLIEEIEKLEHKARRQDILVDESLIAQFYDERIPQAAYNLKTLEAWANNAPEAELKALYLSKDELLSKRAGEVTTDYYPKAVEMGSMTFALSYHFEPGSPKDGVTMAVPLMLLNQVNAQQCEWLVPGMLKEKVHLLLKSLPQKLRRHCVPLPQFAEQFTQSNLSTSRQQKALLEVLRDYVAERTPARPALSDFRVEGLPAHHFMNFKLMDAHGRQLDMQRSLSALKAEWGKDAQQTFKASTEAVRAQLQGASSDSSKEIPKGASAAPARQGGQASRNVDGQPIVDWSFGELPELLEITRAGQTFFGYPALKDMGEHCQIEVYDQQEDAQRVHEAGVLRLFAIALKEPLKFLNKNLVDFQKIAMLYMPIGSADELREQWIKLALKRASLASGLPNDAKAFENQAQQAKGRISLIAQEIGKLSLAIMTEYSTVLARIKSAGKSFPQALEDIQTQLQWLLPKQFLLQRPWEQLVHYPRYLKAIVIRLERLRNSADRDQASMKELSQLQLNWVRANAQLKGFEDESLSQFAWQLQELRVSLFAQELRTPMSVSVKRLQKAWDMIQKRTH